MCLSIRCPSGGTKSTYIVTSSVLRRGQPDSRETCIVLQSGPTCSLIVKFLQRSVVAWSTQILCCRERNNCSYVSSAYLPSDSLHKILAWWTVTRRTSKTHKTVQIGGRPLAQDNTVHLHAHIHAHAHVHAHVHIIMYACTHTHAHAHAHTHTFYRV